MKVTDNLLSQYIVDSGKLNDQELEAIRNFLSRNPEELDIIATIRQGLDESNMERDLSCMSHPIAVVPFTDAEISERCNQNRARALEVLDDIMVERSEEELIAHFGEQAVHCDNRQAKREQPTLVTVLK